MTHAATERVKSMKKRLVKKMTAYAAAGAMALSALPAAKAIISRRCA
jgi:hypothetical protein